MKHRKTFTLPGAPLGQSSLTAANPASLPAPEIEHGSLRAPEVEAEIESSSDFPEPWDPSAMGRHEDERH